jgi:hypothetical protein
MLKALKRLCGKCRRRCLGLVWLPPSSRNAAVLRFPNHHSLLVTAHEAEENVEIDGSVDHLYTSNLPSHSLSTSFNAPT